MDWFAKVFIRASLLWFIAGITLGLAMTIHPARVNAEAAPSRKLPTPD